MKNNKTVLLCRPCREMVAGAYTLTTVRAGADMKITCDCCHKRRYGAEYKVEGRKK